MLEISAYPKSELSEQLARDALLVWLDRRRLPEVICLVLHPRGRSRTARQLRLQSARQNTRLAVSWKVIELWKLPGEQLLDFDKPGVVPWVPLTKFSGHPGPVFHRCREIIDRTAAPDEHENLLAVTQILASLRYNDPRLLEIFGGREAMIEFPAVRAIVCEGQQKMLLTMLESRFGSVPADVEEELRAINDDDKLIELAKCAGKCPDVEAFRTELERYRKEANLRRSTP